MGLFSRNKSKPQLNTAKSNASLQSGSSSIRSPSAFTASNKGTNRTSNGTASIPQTPLTPFSPGQHAFGHMHTMPKVDLPRAPDPALDPAGYLKSLGSVRERSKIVLDKALKNELNHFDVDMSKFSDVVSFVSQIIRRDYDAPFTSIPPHGCAQHFAVGGRDRIAQLLATFPDTVDSTEKCRRLVDLFLVSVLLDAGAGTQWTFKSAENGRIYRRSEGIAIASLEMFKAGLFSSNPANKYQVDKRGMQALTVEKLASGMQSKPGNLIAGLEGRFNLLSRLSSALDAKTDLFGSDGRPGHLVDYLLAHPSTQASSMPIVLVPTLWGALMTGLAPVWPATRTTLNGVNLGDAWPCNIMPQPSVSSSPTSFSPFPNTNRSAAAWESILPFHKITQWLTYSLMQPMQSLLRIHFAGTELLTGLPEYRNGGLFIDLGVLTLKQADNERGLQNYATHCRKTGVRGVEVAPMFETGDDVVVEWRGVTVGFLDRLCVEVNRALANELAGGELTLQQLLEAGSWKGGREIAEVSRPNTKEPPILIDSDGTVF